MKDGGGILRTTYRTFAGRDEMHQATRLNTLQLNPRVPIWCGLVLSALAFVVMFLQVGLGLFWDNPRKLVFRGGEGLVIVFTTEDWPTPIAGLMLLCALAFMLRRRSPTARSMFVAVGCCLVCVILVWMGMFLPGIWNARPPGLKHEVWGVVPDRLWAGSRWHALWWADWTMHLRTLVSFCMLACGIVFFALGQRIRQASTLCRRCSYDLRGAAHERCPECGTIVGKTN